MNAARVLPAIATALCAAAIAGCGLGAGTGTSNARLTVTADFGSRPVGGFAQAHVPGAETVMTMLERSFRVSTSYGGGFVDSIDGRSGGSGERDWFYYVNGLLAPKGAAGTAVHRGDRIWWDLHDWSSAESIPAVVGSFPEPFLSGTGGSQLPTVVDCAQDVSGACTSVAAALSRAGVRSATQDLGGLSSTGSLDVVVGTWSDLGGVIAASLIARGPRSSGVFARYVGASGQALELLDPRGDVVRTLHGSTGLIAATEQSSVGQTIWVVTGSDRAGVSAAAAALTPARLKDHFALAIAPGGGEVPVPVDPAR